MPIVQMDIPRAGFKTEITVGVGGAIGGNAVRVLYEDGFSKAEILKQLEAIRDLITERNYP